MGAKLSSVFEMENTFLLSIKISLGHLRYTGMLSGSLVLISGIIRLPILKGTKFNGIGISFALRTTNQKIKKQIHVMWI